MESRQQLVAETELLQTVVVMRHGDRMDNAEPLWVSTAARPWDPPIIDAGKKRARATGRALLSGPPFGRAFVSPFLRCVQTAAEAVTALCAVGDDGSDAASIDPSKMKVSIEYGLCEVMNTNAIRQELVPKDGNWMFNVADLEALLPAGTVDSSVDKVYNQLPNWPETMAEARSRYKKMFIELANRHKNENLLIVTHGEGVGVAVSAFKEKSVVYEVEYCGYVQLERKVRLRRDGEYDAGEFKVVATTGVRWQDEA